MRKLFLIFVLLPLFLFAEEPSKGKIVGKILDANTKKEIVGAVVQILNSDNYTVSDTNGFFQLNGLSPKKYNLKISAPYYVTIYKPGIPASTSFNLKNIIELKPAAYQLGEIEVRSKRIFDSFENQNISTNFLSADEIQKGPGTAEDLNRMMMNLPGIASTTDSRNDLIVRGGNPAENLLLVDGVEIPNSNHYGTQGSSGGAFGMINTDFLENVSFSAGGFPAKFGDRLSSVMDVRYRNGNKSRLTGRINVGLTGAGFLIEGPIQKEKSSFIFSARRSYLSLILPLTSITVIPVYSDFNLKATYEFSQNQKLEIIGLGGTDKIEYSGFQNQDNMFIQNSKYSGWQGVLGLVHKWIAGDNTFIQSSFSTDIYQKNIDSHFLGRQSFYNNSLEKEFMLNSDVTQKISNSSLLEAGFDGSYLYNNYDFYRGKKRDEFGNLENPFNYIGIADAFKFGSYLQFTNSYIPQLNFTLGIRQDYFSGINKKNTFSPRVSASYSLFSNFKLKSAYGIYRQDPSLLWLIADERNKNLLQMKTTQFVSGIEYYPSDDIKITLEYFRKKYDDYAASVFNPKISYANEGIDYQTTGLEYLVPGSSGYADGIEFFLNKKLTKKLYGTLSYSYSNIIFKGLDGISRPASFDYKNIFTVVLGYVFSENLELSGKWKYMGGRPYTPFDLTLSKKYNQTVFDYNQYNELRLPSYQRLDFRVDYRIQFTNWNLVTFVDIQNLLNRRNIDQIVWNQRKNQADQILQLTLLPAFGIKVEFN